VAEQVSGALARAHLEDTQRRLSAAVEQAAEAVFVTDTEGFILYVNPAFEQITGYSQPSIVGQRPSALRHGDEDPHFHPEMWQAVRAGKVWQERFEFRRRDGNAVLLDLTTTAVRNQVGEIVNYVSTMRDVTREAQLEKQFQEAQKMEALGRLAGGVAHDFNNLLTVIELSTQLLGRKLHSQDPLWEHVHRIQEINERATRLTGQLLSFSRREIIEPSVLNLNQVVGDLSRMLQRVIGEDTRLRTRLADDLWPVQADLSRMDQVIVNLVVNARDAMPGGGTVTIETANIVLDEAYAAIHVAAQPGEYARLAVSDTGIGMSDEVKARIFEPFFTTKEREHGTGLGLATVFGIVKQIGGHIEVYSELGQGTTFKIYLPRTKEAEPAAKIPSRPPAMAGRAGEFDPNGWVDEAQAYRASTLAPLARGSETVLLVEDEPPVRELAVRVLESCGYEVLAAGDGLDALRISEQRDGPIHLLLSDVVLPHMSGKELAEQLKAARPEVRVMYMSGYTDQAIAQHGVLTSGDAFLPKPFTIEELTWKVHELLAAKPD
jgi:PAS domain S-box-containing protein